jgi:3-dehydroquinate dehydratase-1
MMACVSIAEKNIIKAIAIAKKFEIAEFRLDLCEYNSEQIHKAFSAHANLIATYRGEAKDVLKKVETLKLAINFGAAYIDIEYNLEEKYLYELLEFAHNHRVKVILSHHNFEYTDELSILEEIIAQCHDRGATYVKIATKATSRLDFLRIQNLYKDHSDIIAFCLGDPYRISRISCLILGAPFTYVYNGNKKNQTAEGQLSFREYEDLIRIFSAAIPTTENLVNQIQQHSQYVL